MSARVPSTLPPAQPPAGPEDKVTEVVPRPLRAPAIATGDPELDPLVSYLKTAFAAAIKDGHRLVIMATTDLDDLNFGKPYQNLVDGLLRQASDQVPAEMIRDFCEKNRESRAVRLELTRHLPASLLTSEEQTAIFSGSADLADDHDAFIGVWNRFYAKYPGSPGIITVSRVGLNRDKTMAFFYVGNQRASLAGDGRLHVLKKEGDVWVELPIQIGPSWVS